MKTKSILTTIFLFLAFTIQAKLPEHPCLLLTQKGIEKIKKKSLLMPFVWSIRKNNPDWFINLWLCAGYNIGLLLYAKNRRTIHHKQ